MSAYSPAEAWVVLVVTIALLVVLVGGHALAHRCSTVAARSLAWSGLLLGTLALERVTDRSPAGFRMIALIAFALLVMKVVVVIEERARGMDPLTFGAWLGFAAAWLGMQPRLFVAAGGRPLSGAGTLIRRGAKHVLLGALLVGLARLAWQYFDSALLASVLLLPGLSLLVHFGFCNLIAGGWRLHGVSGEALFRAPLQSENLSTFWARRWNLAFSEMTAIAIYRPLAQRAGRAPALVAAFALSGLLHEMAISVPVRAGFGLPLLYFLLHGGLVAIERARSEAGRPVQGRCGRAWVLLWVAAPLPLLFHRPFLAGVVWPLIGMSPGE